MVKNENILGEILVKRGIITAQALSSAQELSAKHYGRLIPSLLTLNPAKEDAVIRAFSEELNLPVVRLRDLPVENTVIKKVPVRFAAYYQFMPIKLVSPPPDASGKNLEKLTIAVSSPLDIRRRDELRLQLGCEIEMVLALSDEITQAIKKYYGFAADTIEKLSKYGMDTITDVSLTQSDEKVEDIETVEKTEDVSVIKLVNQIILEAYSKRATDIHIEPYRGKIKLRYRVDGILYNMNIPPAMKKFFPSILSRIKIMSNLNIVERRLPQDGRCIIKTEKETFDMRVSIIPTPWGESIVIRLLPTKMLYSLSELGLVPSELAIINQLLDKPHGIIFVTGPTGSGKTTTLYAALSKLNTQDAKILTIEDPIEYELEGITQIQVMPEIGLTFARGLRSMLRHDPDIMMVGEVRDFETAEITIRIALTGHLIFSTLHTNDAASSVTRLIDMGIEPYLTTSSVEAFIAQRLVRTICPNCKIEDTLVPFELLKKEFNLPEGAKSFKIYKGRGCDSCNQTGFLGRTAIYEILLLDSKIKRLILSKAPSDEIKLSAMEEREGRVGMNTLRQSGFSKMLAGLTTFDEVTRITPSDPAAPAVKAEMRRPTLLGEPRPEGREAERADTTKKTTEVGAAAPAGASLAPEGREDVPRTFKRLNIRIPLEYSLYKTTLDSFQELTPKYTRTVTTDISASGIQFDANTPPLVGAIMRLRIFLPAVPTIECLVRVVRVEMAHEPQKRADLMQEKYWISCYYLDIESVAKTSLDNFISKFTPLEIPR
ncbi:MAG: ATPase, T2SS/T4P/T4SS family [Planctomycetota bacterium]|nr:ATPase, T2SS/T4P/T4SS family [Planctomycetota bacterium]MDI6787889.1 ATPase, T2SS/T4P/T4SS family [Planctomycetota bacterium]